MTAPVPGERGCPAPNDLAAFARRALPEDRSEEVLLHLASCPACRRIVSLLVRQSETEPDPEPLLLPDAMASFGAAPRPKEKPAPASPRFPMAAAALLLVALAAAALVARGAVPGGAAPPADPASPEGVRLVLSRAGLRPAAVDPAPAPYPRGFADPLPLSPRGALRGPPAEVVLWAAAPRERSRVLIVEDPPGEGPPLFHRVVPNVYRRAALPIPEGAGFRAGGRYEVRVLDREGRTAATAAFRILPEEEAASTLAEEARVERALAGDPAGFAFARADVLLARGLAEEALAAAAALRERHPGRREPARIALAALESLGLRDSAAWADWLAALEAGR